VELIGHSVGGKVAQAVALLQPERIKGLVAIDIAPVRYTPDEPHWKAVQDIIQALISVSEPRGRQNILGKISWVYGQ
jgi:pimeloyl-ACP methyl ester carboxylesterase